eukprot:snap_masked-scaffold49_size462716-processed-gene-3.3 protein:Tk03622 transcript:snap_masked-scaffold49_size462716-processed-gene-3.3-mRNA-1 annotation:"AGAP007930-PA"
MEIRLKIVLKTLLITYLAQGYEGEDSPTALKEVLIPVPTLGLVDIGLFESPMDPTPKHLIIHEPVPEVLRSKDVIVPCDERMFQLDPDSLECRLILGHPMAEEHFTDHVLGLLPGPAFIQVLDLGLQCPKAYRSLFKGLMSMWAGPVPTWVASYINGNRAVMGNLRRERTRISDRSLKGLLHRCSVLVGTQFLDDFDYYEPVDDEYRNANPDLPDEKPRITGVKESYQVGENIKASCTSWQSHPPANLTWFINGEPAKESYLKRYELRLEFDETFTSVLGLHFDVRPMHFHGNAMVLKCTSSLLSIYWQSSEMRIKQQVPHISHMINSQIPSSTRRGNSPTVLDKPHPPTKKDNMPVEQLTSHNYSGSGNAHSVSAPLIGLESSTTPL